MAFAPVIGSYVSFLLGWRGNFSILLLLGLICLVLGILFIPKSQVNYNVKISLREYNVIFKSKKTIYYLIIAIFILQSYWVFIAISPIYYMRDLGVPIQQFGFYQEVMAAICCIGNFSSSYFLKRFEQKKCLFFGVLMLSAFIISAIILVTYKINDPLIITIVIRLIAIGIIFPCNIL
jgi:DHA1 family bicyclomycin/chloramphenicol resistance-like MFS transporter